MLHGSSIALCANLVVGIAQDIVPRRTVEDMKNLSQTSPYCNFHMLFQLFQWMEASFSIGVFLGSEKAEGICF